MGRNGPKFIIYKIKKKRELKFNSKNSKVSLNSVVATEGSSSPIETVEMQQAVITKPSRSDEILNEDQRLEITNKVRAQFESLAPKRPFKPNRSESDSTTALPPATSYAPDQNDYVAPELDKLRSLQTRSQVLEYIFPFSFFYDSRFY